MFLCQIMCLFVLLCVTGFLPLPSVYSIKTISGSDWSLLVRQAVVYRHLWLRTWVQNPSLLGFFAGITCCFFARFFLCRFSMQMFSLISALSSSDEAQLSSGQVRSASATHYTHWDRRLHTDIPLSSGFGTAVPSEGPNIFMWVFSWSAQNLTTIHVAEQLQR